MALAAEDNGSGRLVQWYKGIGFTQVGVNRRGRPQLEAPIVSILPKMAGQRCTAVGLRQPDTTVTQTARVRGSNSLGSIVSHAVTRELPKGNVAFQALHRVPNLIPGCRQLPFPVLFRGRIAQRMEQETGPDRTKIISVEEIRGYISKGYVFRSLNESDVLNLNNRNDLSPLGGGTSTDHVVKHVRQIQHSGMISVSKNTSGTKTFQGGWVAVIDIGSLAKYTTDDILEILKKADNATDNEIGNVQKAQECLVKGSIPYNNVKEWCKGGFASDTSHYKQAIANRKAGQSEKKQKEQRKLSKKDKARLAQLAKKLKPAEFDESTLTLPEKNDLERFRRADEQAVTAALELERNFVKGKQRE
jgi:hypothetical protein